MSDLEQIREEVIRKIEEVLGMQHRKTAIRNWKIARDVICQIEKTFRGKTWQEAISIFEQKPYYFTDGDCVQAFTWKGFRYYLPAFLIAASRTPSLLCYNNGIWFIRELVDCVNEFSVAETEVIVSFFAYHAEYWRILGEHSGCYDEHWYDDSVETEAVRWMLILDEKKAEGGIKGKL